MKNFTILLLLISNLTFGQTIKVVSDFPGGNIKVSKILHDTLFLKPDLSFTKGKWFYWNFQVSNISGKKVVFEFEQSNVFTKFGPAYSINNDNNWKWLDENSVSNNSFSYSFSKNDTTAYFSVAFPYTEKNLNNFYAKLNNKDLIKKDILCYSEQNRAVERILISPKSKKPIKKIVLTARHHACEVSASYVLEGIIESILNDINLQYLRDNIEFLIIPFVDKDGVENGEQGKNRIPHDHNRDYNQISIYNSTEALKSVLKNWGNDNLTMAIDIHSPWINGKHNEDIYIVGTEDSTVKNNQLLFSKLIEQNVKGDFKYYHDNYLPFGKAWNTNNNYSNGLTFSNWTIQHLNIEIALPLEVPYANISGTPFSKDAARVFGKTIAYAINDYLKLQR